MQKTSIAFILIFFSLFGRAQKSGGMWIPTELNEKEMKEMGMKISAHNIFDSKKPTLKDAIVRFGSGCTGEIISDKGLVLTNHHCGYSSIQRLSSVGNDLLTNGFWAKGMQDELPSLGLTVTFTIDLKDVTNEMLMGTNGLSGDSLQQQINTNSKQLINELKLAGGQNAYTKAFYKGNKYYLFIEETFRDVRLVGTPPESIGKFGADTDNWVWPRHTGDFSLFRVYADKNNKPADYAKENVPYKPKHFLPMSAKGIKEDDFVLIFGFPGATDEYLPAVALDQVQNYINPARIEMRDSTLKIMDEKMRADKAVRIKYAAKHASIANYWKKWIGENQGLKRSNAIEKRADYEKKISKKNPAIHTLLGEFGQLYHAQNRVATSSARMEELVRNSDGFRLGLQYIYFMQLYNANTWGAKEKDKLLATLQNIYTDYDADLDLSVTASLLSLMAKREQSDTLAPFPVYYDFLKNNYGKSVVTGMKKWNNASVLTHLDSVFADPKTLFDELTKDSIISFMSLLVQNFREKEGVQYMELQNKIDDLQKKYMALQLETDKDKEFFPDANSTLRVSYGKVKGSQPRDGIYYLPQTYLKGVIEKYVPGDYEFDVPEKLVNLYNAKDFGPYKDATGDVPIAFTSTSHTTGGNSGSPAIDAQGNLVGINFDRQWEGTMSDLNYDPEICRNIMVDVRYLLFLIDKFADAKWILNEMKIVN